MLRSVFTKTLRDARRALLWWTIGLIGLVLLTVTPYPSLRSDESLNETVQNLPEAVKRLFTFSGELDFTSPAGYLGGRFYSFLFPLLLLAAAIGAGARAIAGEEERGTLDLLLSNPVPRMRVALDKLGALAVEVTLFGVVVWTMLTITGPAFDLEIGAGQLAAATLDAVLLAIGFGAIALAVGAATGNRGLAAGVTAAAAVAAYLVNSFAGLVDVLDRIKVLSPFYHYGAGDPLRNGLAAGHTAFLLAVALGAGALGLVLFDRRDLAA